jgi:hypothetical protein
MRKPMEPDEHRGNEGNEQANNGSAQFDTMLEYGRG